MKSLLKFGSLTALARLINIVSIMLYAKIAGPQLFSEFTLYLVSVTTINNIVTSGVTPSIVRQLNETKDKIEEINCLANYFATMSITLVFTIFAYKAVSTHITNNLITINDELIYQLIILSLLIIMRVLVEANYHHLNKQNIIPILKIVESSILCLMMLINRQVSPFNILLFSFLGYLMIPVYQIFLMKNASNVPINPKLRITRIFKNLAEISILSVSSLISAPVIPILLRTEATVDKNSPAYFGLANQIHAISIFIPTTLNTYLIKKIIEKRSEDAKLITIQIGLGFAVPLILLLIIYMMRQPIQSFYSQYENILTNINILLIAAMFHANSKTLNTYLLRENKAAIVLMSSMIYCLTAYFVYYLTQNLNIPRVEISVMSAYTVTFIAQSTVFIYLRRGRPNEQK